MNQVPPSQKHQVAFLNSCGNYVPDAGDDPDVILLQRRKSSIKLHDNKRKIEKSSLISRTTKTNSVAELPIKKQPRFRFHKYLYQTDL